MASAGRPFTWELLLRLERQGIGLSSISLHTGLSATRNEAIDASHPIYTEEYQVTEQAVAAITASHSKGGRVIAVGTTVVRALETAADSRGRLRPATGLTRLHINAGYVLRVVDGLLTGLHEPESSHLDLLSAFIQPERLRAAYLEAIQMRYLWHEFGDMNLII
jgi:S-adenosylmethionine:tRNA ribosyltransferase-isomerase